MDDTKEILFSELICRNYAVDQATVSAVMAGDGDINFQELLAGAFKGFDELEALGLVSERELDQAKIAIAAASYWAGDKIREFDEKRHQ